jgi:hypothetical protein
VKKLLAWACGGIVVLAVVFRVVWGGSPKPANDAEGGATLRPVTPTPASRPNSGPDSRKDSAGASPRSEFDSKSVSPKQPAPALADLPPLTDDDLPAEIKRRKADPSLSARERYQATLDGALYLQGLRMERIRQQMIEGGLDPDKVAREAAAKFPVPEHPQPTFPKNK